MKIKALSTFRGDEGTIRRGAEVDVSTAYGKALVKLGRAIELASDKPRKPRNSKKSNGAPAPNEGE